ncbi:MAG: NfeD family protein [Vicinamibacterales bacterium]
MTWWLWLAGGMILLVFELLTPSGFFVMFFGVGAILTGVMASVGLVTTPAVQWLVFTACSVVTLLLFRSSVQRRVEPDRRPSVDALVGEVAYPTEALAPGSVGRVMLRGSSWEARNDGMTVLGAHQRCRVARVTGLQVGIVAE